MEGTAVAAVLHRPLSSHAARSSAEASARKPGDLCSARLQRYKLHLDTAHFEIGCHFIRARVETRRFQAMGQVDSTCTAPPGSTAATP
jgi:hypothetical protein